MKRNLLIAAGCFTIGGAACAIAGSLALFGGILLLVGSGFVLKVLDP